MPEEQKKTKICPICQNQFKARSGSHKFCSLLCKTKNNQLNGSMMCTRQYERISGDWARYFNRLINRKRKGVLSTKELLGLLEKQNYKCALSGLTLTCLLEQGKKFKTNASIDRIIPGKPYTIDNVQLVCSALNSWRSDTNLAEFLWFCKQVTKYQEEKEQSSYAIH